MDLLYFLPAVETTVLNPRQHPDNPARSRTCLGAFRKTNISQTFPVIWSVLAKMIGLNGRLKREGIWED